MRIGVLGAGSWAIALAVLLYKRKHTLTMWEFNREEAEQLINNREHHLKLPGVFLPEQVTITNNLRDIFINPDYVICAVPAQTVRKTLQLLKEQVASTIIETVKAWIIVSKGIECSSLSLLSDIFLDELPGICKDRICVLSGPSHAEEVSRDIPTTVVAASINNALAVEVQNQFATETFRIYTNNDIIGVELCASVKNIIALAAGISDGLGYGDNTKGALLTRGMVEMARLGIRMGADERTFNGLAGFGDLVTTCTSRHSRNRKMGELIASGLNLQQALEKMTMVAEGIETTKSVYQLARKYDIEMPITAEVYKTLFEGKSPHAAVKDLMMRQFKSEQG